ncbi:hypothetical protein [Bacillus gaemokensis]|uniref:Uncharacterized protein n=1 Tax=Bacillus gaemokensis TaxID=574375 RepID=A0A073KBZ0_9BACI|nr:hypothetical protein [Bacillus gaemokensis]KEK23937.1 hypothetical protein BAGA_05830 [Bacillus gaemokensis]KYG38059.1 hypothetical protein AZF08_20075 [Bacillus gaemokensis]
MIIDYNFFGYAEGCVWDTPICTDHMDELQLNEGIYDEAFVTLDTNVVDSTAKPTNWTLQTLMDAKFTGDLDAGSIGADGFKVTKILLYRSVVGTFKWEAVAEFDYDPEYNVYDYVDRYTENGALYQYAIVPVANEVLGDKLISDEVKSEYEGIFLTDKYENKRFEYDIQLGDITYNQSSSVNQPIDGQFPIVVFGNSNYRSGNLSVLPLSNNTVALAGGAIDKLAEQVNRQDWVDFLNNGKAKVLRMDSGVLMLVVTQNANVQHKEGDLLRDLANISFDFLEIGKLDFGAMIKNDLIAPAHMQKMTFDDDGGVISG